MSECLVPNPLETPRNNRLSRAEFVSFRSITTRWMDNDVYGHANNVIYYSWFDTAVNGWLIDHELLDFRADQIVALVVETGCTYFESVAFPERIETGLAIERIGRSSVIYRIGIFRENQNVAAAQGRFTHVYVDRKTQRPVPIPDRARVIMAELLLSSSV
jgi:acyl-CoA thioester hydrolase